MPDASKPEPAGEIVSRLRQATETLLQVGRGLRSMRDRVGSTEPEAGSAVADAGEPPTLLAWADKVVHEAEDSLGLVNKLAQVV